MTIKIHSVFDSGNIEVVSVDDPQNVRLRIRQDSYAEFFQWFNFVLEAAPEAALCLVIENAGEASYAEGWHGYQCVASSDRKTWWRVADTSYDGAALTIRVTMPTSGRLQLAYFTPYSQERQADFLATCSAAGAAVRSLGVSVQGRSIDALTVASSAAKPLKVWVIARQHPGETMAQWCAQGLVQALLDGANPTARAILQLAQVQVVPNINPDGSFLGNLRSNAAGANLNREWARPSLARSPEVLCVQQALHASGVDLFIDLHGDETLPYVFIYGSHMVPGYGERNRALQAAFLQDFLAASPDFQTQYGYEDDRFSEELLSLGSKWVAHTFGCVGLTLEMPFKDASNSPDARYGWSAPRSEQLGAALLQPILGHLRRLQERADVA